MLKKLLQLFKKKNSYMEKHDDYWKAYQQAEKEREKILETLISVRTELGKSNGRLAGYLLKAQEDFNNLSERKDAEGVLLQNLTRAFIEASLEHINTNNRLIARMIEYKK